MIQMFNSNMMLLLQISHVQLKMGLAIGGIGVQLRSTFTAGS